MRALQKMNQIGKTSCDVCGRGTKTHYAHIVPAHRLDEPNRYTICSRADCDSLGDHLTWWLRENPDVDWHTFEELLGILDGHEHVKKKFTPTWERPARRSLPGDPAQISDFTGGNNAD